MDIQIGKSIYNNEEITMATAKSSAKSESEKPESEAAAQETEAAKAPVTDINESKESQSAPSEGSTAPSSEQPAIEDFPPAAPINAMPASQGPGEKNFKQGFIAFSNGRRCR